jgi:hypothetical protein
MNTCGGVEIALPFLNSALDGGEFLASRLCRFVPRGNSHRHPFDRMLGGLHRRSGRYGEKKNLTPAGNRTPAV